MELHVSSNGQFLLSALAIYGYVAHTTKRMFTLRKIVGEGKMAVITTVAEPLVLDVLNNIEIDYWNLFVDESYVIYGTVITEEEHEDGEVPRRGYRVDVRSTANLQLIRSIWIEREPGVDFDMAKYSNGLFIIKRGERNGASYAGRSYQIWDVATGRCTAQIPEQQPGSYRTLILNEGKSFVSISRRGVSLWDLQTISNGCSPSLSWSVQTGGMEVLGDWSRFHADNYQMVLVAKNGNKVKMLTLDFLQGDINSIQTQQSLMAKIFKN